MRRLSACRNSSRPWNPFEDAVAVAADAVAADDADFQWNLQTFDVFQATGPATRADQPCQMTSPEQEFEALRAYVEEQNEVDLEL